MKIILDVKEIPELIHLVLRELYPDTDVDFDLEWKRIKNILTVLLMERLGRLCEVDKKMAIMEPSDEMCTLVDAALKSTFGDEIAQHHVSDLQVLGVNGETMISLNVEIESLVR